MQVTVESTGQLERTMKVRVPAGEIEQEIAQRLRKVAQTAQLKGFRAGKIPPKVVHKYYGGQVREEVLNEVLRRSYQQAIEQNRLAPATGPRIEPEELRPGEDFSYTAVFEVMPQIEFQNLDLSVERPVVEVTDADVERVLERLRKQRSTWEPTTEPASKDDRVLVDFVGSIDGVPFEGGEGREAAIVLGEGSMLADFENSLLGMTASQEKTIELTFPADYHHEPLQGKNAQFAITVQGVARRTIPALDDAFAQALGIEDGVDAIRARLRGNMQTQLIARIAAQLHRQVLQHLADANPVDTPEAMVQEEAKALRQDAMRRMGIEDDSQGPPLVDFLDSARRRVVLGLLIHELARREKIRVTAEQLNAHIQAVAAGYDRPEEVVRVYQSDSRMRGQAETAVLEQQVAQWLIGRASITDKAIGYQEFVGE